MIKHAVPLLLGALVAASPPAAGQSVQYRAPGGREYRSQRDTGAIARAETALAVDPRNVDRLIALGVAQSGVRQYREAIATFSKGLAIAPNNALLYRWRGHRYLSTRQLDRALDDLTRGARLDSTIYGIWYHLGIVKFARRDFSGAVDAFSRALPIAPDSGERAGATDWLWMSLARAGRGAEAQGLLDRRPDVTPGGNAYDQRLRLYRGQVSPDAVFTPADTSDIAVATLSYGIGNWYLVRGDTTNARKWFERSVASGGWPAFGFILSEVELRSLPKASGRVGILEHRFGTDSSGPTVDLKKGVVYWAELTGPGTPVLESVRGRDAAFIVPIEEGSTPAHFQIYPRESGPHSVALVGRGSGSLATLRLYQDLSETNRIRDKRDRGVAIGFSFGGGRHTGLGIDSLGGAAPRGGVDWEGCVLLQSGDRFGTCAGAGRQTFPDADVTVGWLFLEERARLFSGDLFRGRTTDFGAVIRFSKAMGVGSRNVYPGLFGFGVLLTQHLASAGRRHGASLYWSWQHGQLHGAQHSKDRATDRFVVGMSWLP
jgi:tetratricopeptide (TPR) repeat protein